MFDENIRDPLTEALRDTCERLNSRKLQRDDSRLRFAVEPPPTVQQRFA